MSENISKEDLTDGQMSLMDHLTELRSRLLISIVVFVILFLLCLVKIGDPSSSIADQVYLFLQKPLADLLSERGGRMIFTGLHEGFFTQIKVAFFTSISISLPIILMQVWKFVAPGLYKNERNAMLPFMIATPFLFILGAAMVYYMVIPLAWQFFLSFEINPGQGALPIEVEPRISEYLSLVMRLMFAFGLSFELPVVLLLLVKSGFVTPEGLASKRRYAILTSFVAAAILTPPDVISQVMLATPIIILYEISIIAARIMYKKDKN
jgi:sec-independent protein translocase protein TatC